MTVYVCKVCKEQTPMFNCVFDSKKGSYVDMCKPCHTASKKSELKTVRRAGLNRPWGFK